mgnify:CR=1 FL=1
MWPVGVRRRRVDTGGVREEERRVVSGLVRSIVCEMVVVVGYVVPRSFGS